MKLEAEMTCPITLPIPFFTPGMELETKERENKILNES